LTEP